MVKIYNVILTDRFYLDIEHIYEYIAYTLCDPMSAKKYYNDIKKAACSLNILPNRGTLLRVNSKVDFKFRQIFVENYTIIYYVEGMNVIISAVLYGKSDIASKFEGETDGIF